MMVKRANDGLLQANDSQILVIDGEMSVRSSTHFTIIDAHNNYMPLNILSKYIYSTHMHNIN